MAGKKRSHGSRSVSRGRRSARSPSVVRGGSSTVPQKKKAKHSSKKRSKTRSVSRTVRQEEEGGQHNDLSSSYISITNGVVPKKYRGVVKSSIQHQFGFNYKQQASGLQWIYTVGSLITRGQMVNAGAATGTPDRDSWPGNPWEMNPYATNTGSSLLASIASPSLDRAYIHNITGEITMTGLENIPQEVTLYLVKHKISNNNRFEDEWASVLAAAPQFNQAASANPVGAGVATYGRPSLNTYDQKPFVHPVMRKEFKVLATRRHTIEPGATHKLRYRIAYNRMLSKEFFTDSAVAATTPSSVPVEFMKGWTMSWVAVMKGAPVFNSTASKMTIGPVDIGFTHTYRVNFSYPMEKRLYAFRTDAGFVNSSTLADDKIINDIDSLTNVAQL